MTATTATRRPAGRPPKIANPHRWHLVVNRAHRDAGERRAKAEAREGLTDLTDVLRALMADYAAGRVTPTEAGRDEVAA